MPDPIGALAPAIKSQPVVESGGAETPEQLAGLVRALRDWEPDLVEAREPECMAGPIEAPDPIVIDLEPVPDLVPAPAPAVEPVPEPDWVDPTWLEFLASLEQPQCH